MPRKNLRRAASKEALKQMQLLSATAYEEDDTETFEITSDDDVVGVDMPPKKKYRLSHRKSSDGNDRDVIVLKSINAGEEILKLDLWTEELSPVQQELRSKSEKELQELTTKLEQITKNANADVLYQGESCSAYEIDTTPVVPPLTYTTSKVVDNTTPNDAQERQRAAAAARQRRRRENLSAEVREVIRAADAAQHRSRRESLPDEAREAERVAAAVQQRRRRENLPDEAREAERAAAAAQQRRRREGLRDKAREAEAVAAAVQETKKKTATLPPSKAQQPNVVLQPSKSNNSYQLVMDPRLGLIVGTMTPAAAPSIPPPLTKPQSPVPPVVQTRQTRRRGRNSVQVAALPAQTPPPPTPPPKVPKAAPTPPATPVVQLRPTEATAVGGLSTGATPVQKNNTVTTSTVVDLTSEETRPAADSREISFNKLQGKTFPSLVVVARPHLGVKDISGGDRTKLDSKVKSVLMHVPTKFTEWLIQQGLIRSEQSCTNHANSKLKLGMYSDVSKFPYSGGYVWISECCPHRFVSVFSGSLFEGSPHPPSVILKLIYHWACQTNVQNVVQWVKVENLYVKGMNTWLRALCTVALHSHIAPLGGPGRRVEVGVISLGTTSQDGQQRQVKVEVLGLLESDAKLIRLRAVEPLADGDRNYKKRFSKILEPLLQWVHPESIIVTDLTVDKSTLHTMGFAHVQQSTSSDHSHSNHTIMEYLRRIVPRMFQNTLSLLSRQIIQQFLDELVWREWYGTTAAQCFDNMLIHLSEQTRADTGQSLIMRLNKVAANPFKNWSISTSNQPTTIISKTHLNESSLPTTKRTSGRQRKIINVRAPSPQTTEIQQRPPRTISPDIPEQMVPLENYYYGTIEGQNNTNAKIGWNIKCSMCKSHFSNNIRLMTHLFSHAHNVTGGIQQCRYCLSSVASMEGLAKHIITSHPYETKFQDSYICVICETRFANSFSLGKHLSKEHVPAELPYQCGTCGFRCSSHRQAIDHFYKLHDSGSTIQCPFCLKSTTVCSSGRIMPQNLNFFMQHLQKHQKKAMAKKCPKCALWFIHKDTLKDHQINMHSTQRRKAGLIPWSAPRNGLMVPKSKQDKQVWEDAEREINFSNLTIDAPNKLACKECKMYINMPRHYQSLESCSNRNCQYLTCCKSAMDNHMKICKDLNESLPISSLSKEMYCVCGYSDDDGNTLAKHLAQCERKSAYPSAEAAKKAIKTHSMLDVLGLVRRPEEPPTPQPVVEVVELDKDEKDQPKIKPKDTTKKIRRLAKVDKEKPTIEKAGDAAESKKQSEENIVEIKDDDAAESKKQSEENIVEIKDDDAAESKKQGEENIVEIKDDDDEDDNAGKKASDVQEVAEIPKKGSDEVTEAEMPSKSQTDKGDENVAMEVDSVEILDESPAKVDDPIAVSEDAVHEENKSITEQQVDEKVEDSASAENTDDVSVSVENADATVSTKIEGAGDMSTAAESLNKTAVEAIDEVPEETEDEFPVETIEVPVETLNETPSETINKTPVETIDETSSETVNEAPMETINEAPSEKNEAPVEIIDEASSETVNEAPVETIDEDSSEIVNEAPVETINEAPLETTDEVPPEPMNEIPAETIDEIPAETIDETPADTIDDTLAETIDETPAETIDETPAQTIDDTPAETIDETPAETIDETPAETIDDTPAETIDETPAETIDETPAETIDETPAETLDETPADKDSTTVEHPEKSEAVNNIDSSCGENAMEVDTGIDQSEYNTDLSEKATEVMETDAADE